MFTSARACHCGALLHDSARKRVDSSRARSAGQVEAASLRAEGAAFCLDTDEFALDLAVSLWFGSGIRSLKSAQHVGLAAQEVAADQVDRDALAVAAEFAALALGQRRAAEFFHEG